ncbi:MAG TPA: GGDEF domain-containing protein [Caulobacteraceae bacterium]
MNTAAARTAPLEDVGPRHLGRAVAIADVGFPGLSQAELTPGVQSALSGLMIELADLRGEARRLKARLAEAEAAADADPLTSARNRRAFVREVRRAAAFARRHGAPASLVYFDVDDLKATNDRFGHAAGDAALRAVADRLAAHVRQSDVIGRLGGDEFAVLLEHADQRAAEAKAQMLARLIAAQPVRAGKRLAPVRVSWGARQIDPAKDAETLIAEADAAMFAMKRARSAAA